MVVKGTSKGREPGEIAVLSTSKNGSVDKQWRREEIPHGTRGSSYADDSARTEAKTRVLHPKTTRE